VDILSDADWVLTVATVVLSAIENKNNIISSNDIQTLLCSICKRSDKIITDPESGELICSSCGVVLLDKI
jgi:TFIIB zinc-binding protein